MIQANNPARTAGGFHNESRVIGIHIHMDMDIDIDAEIACVEMIGPSLENLGAQSFTCIAAFFLVERFHVYT